ncbi:hypothetical protein CVT24_011951 [Panaeolus cyanescens]|uniref:Major facilitator superfamily (MFS) profile domain-containing protein n=1 Tax=Panaeolus cyanescens TaxID=181874 RepID=A0A409VIF8_9AGAR|nr:hypothetical protein CVT24_011951 [Panaeolus cyanescens]
MSSANSRRPSIPVRSFGISETDPDAETTTSPGQDSSTARRILGRISFSSLRRGRPISPQNAEIERPLGTPSRERPPIPTMQATGEAYTTPLPILSMIVLSITMLGEFLCANVSTPFLLFMVKGFGEFNDEAEAAFWMGILVATFFLTQFLTSLLWATIAAKHGTRIVLIVSLLGSAVTCLVFGTATSLQQAICIRLLQGVFAGAVGVARGTVAFITDASNEGRAYAILGFCWGLGGVAGAIVGGSFERPAVKWPDIFGNIPIFVEFPYLLPCGIAAFVTFMGSVLACFLGRDGGPREGAIRLLPEKILHPTIPEEDNVSEAVFEEDEPQGISAIPARITRRFSDFLSRRQSESQSLPSQPPVPMSSNPDRPRTFSRTSRVNGSAYGYSGGYRSRLSSNGALTARRGSMGSSMRRRRSSNRDVSGRAPSESTDLNFAQRLLLANENAVNNIADLWVAAAMNVDNEDPFESDSDIEDQGGDEDQPGRLVDVNEASADASTIRPPRSHRPSTATSLHPSVATSRHRSSLHTPLSPGSPRVPTIFTHPGVKTPMAVLDAQDAALERDNPLSPIHESRPPSLLSAQADVESLSEKTPSIFSQLPVVVIIQYGVMALHTTTHDQVFMSYLVSDYDAGGLNLNAGHFAQLIALMCLAQIAYQFYLYPNIGPPRGRFSHLSMFRIGTILFIPAYLTVILYRPFASHNSGDSNLFLMSALSVSTAVRYCGSTFGYTAISILLNYMTPPSAVGYANGIAQSIVSLARCVGPVIGAYLWSMSVQDGPSGYYMGFLICAGVCTLTLFQSLLIR